MISLVSYQQIVSPALMLSDPTQQYPNNTSYFKGIEISFFYVNLDRNLCVMHPPRILNLY